MKLRIDYDGNTVYQNLDLDERLLRIWIKEPDHNNILNPFNPDFEGIAIQYDASNDEFRLYAKGYNSTGAHYEHNGGYLEFGARR